MNAANFSYEHKGMTVQGATAPSSDGRSISPSPPACPNVRIEVGAAKKTGDGGHDIYPLTVTLVDYAEGQVASQCRRFTVHKRFKNFETLVADLKLSKAHRELVPPLPGKAGLFHGVDLVERQRGLQAFLDATVAKASKAAKALGVKDGMPGRDALALIR